MVTRQLGSSGRLYFVLEKISSCWCESPRDDPQVRYSGENNQQYLACRKNEVYSSKISYQICHQINSNEDEKWVHLLNFKTKMRSGWKRDNEGEYTSRIIHLEGAMPLVRAESDNTQSHPGPPALSCIPGYRAEADCKRGLCQPGKSST